ncbi:MAG: DNA adenine methylase [Anaeroplasma sp.]|nr:DNA adenine methylase [Anaeroplasma sp.]
MKINNRRYIGCKTKLLEFIENIIEEYSFPAGSTLADIFAGTGVVANLFANKGYKTIVNDILYSNVVVYDAILGAGKLNFSLLKSEIDYFNSLNPNNLSENYFSKVYGNKYFSVNDCKIIGFIRDYIETNKNKYTTREYHYLISCLMYSCDKIANTVGHFESFLKGQPSDKGVKLDMFEVNNDIYPAEIYNMDANALAPLIKADIVYIDPPYNARQYVNFYHVLENLARWNKPEEFEGTSMKFKRNELKSDYCRSKAPQLFEDLINNLDCRLIVVSYNNTYKAGSISSVNTISEEDMIRILSSKGKLTIKEKDYKAFNSGKTELEGHKEYLYICEVK